MVYLRDSCSAPRFSRDGTHIAFIEADDQTSRIRVITTSGQTLATSQPRSFGCCIAWSPDGRRIAHFAFQGESGKDDVQLWTLADDSYEAAADNAAMYGSLDWSPDGRYLAWGEHTATVLDLHTRQTTTPDDGGTIMTYADLSGDARLVVGGNDVVAIDLAQQRHKVLARDGTEPSWSLDDRRIAFARTARYGVGGFAERNLSVVSAQGGAIRTVVPIPLNHSIHNPRWSADGTFLAFSVARGYL